jgi:hypothetical protein
MPTADKSVLLKYLPAIYQDPGWGDDAAPSHFINDFLLAFEKILLGRNDGVEPEGGSAEYLLKDSRTTDTLRAPAAEEFPNSSAPRSAACARGSRDSGFQGLEEKIDNLHLLFDARRTPESFLEWLAGWSALTLRMELGVESRRALIANIIPLYRIRGTKKCLEQLLALFMGGGATVDDQSWPGIQVGRYSTLAKDTYVGGTTRHYFRVTLSAPLEDEERARARRLLADEAIELAKPAHTFYDLEILTPRFQVGVYSRVGLDTFLA